jgi:hypothetical protein
MRMISRPAASAISSTCDNRAANSSAEKFIVSVLP